MQFFVTCLVALAIAPTPAAPSASPTPPDLKNMMVYGDGFAFFVREPDGWVGHAPSDVGLGNASFYSSTENAKTATTIISVQIMDYDGPDVEGDLTADMARWRAKYSTSTFEDLTATNPRYKTFGKLYLTPGEDPSYAVYVDPGPATKLYFIVSMEPPKRRATPDELAALDEVVTSLQLLTASVSH
ncbi:MAG TPA: hypothetical protein VID24_03320 [Candidatus Eremiobacteraceae bacterium]|jgi:hypothetical protein